MVNKNIFDSRRIEELNTLIQYDNVNIENVAGALGPITVDFMNQCYSALNKWCERNKKDIDKRPKIKEMLVKQLEDMQTAIITAYKQFSTLECKSKRDVFKHIFDCQITEKLYNSYLFSVLYEVLRGDYGFRMWDNDSYIQSHDRIDLTEQLPLIVLKDTKKDERSINVNFNYAHSVSFINKAVEHIYDDTAREKRRLELIDNISQKIMRDYPKSEQTFQQTISDLARYLIAYNEYERTAGDTIVDNQSYTKKHK